MTYYLKSTDIRDLTQFEFSRTLSCGCLILHGIALILGFLDEQFLPILVNLLLLGWHIYMIRYWTSRINHRWSILSWFPLLDDGIRLKEYQRQALVWWYKARNLAVIAGILSGIAGLIFGITSYLSGDFGFGTTMTECLMGLLTLSMIYVVYNSHIRIHSFLHPKLL